ncbi:hypothetical protein M3Y94_00421300 [Aphelenchoides besseyi]|nr:hypothetical protein M3Y94_00421300 [Aphelenchoides besseyi]KAI6229563.1 hypothetical protein M3Y95_00544000 [Aphelenchoides besseyi]
MSLINYDSDGKVLSAEQRKAYERDGYIIVKNCVPQYELQRYFNRFKEICEGKNVPVELTVMRDVSIAKSEFIPGEKAITKIQDFNNDPVLFDYCKYPAIVDIVEDLIGTPNSSLMSMHTMLINKPSDNGSLSSRHPLHQDLNYFPFRPADYICCAWTSMERVHRKNGCLIVVPGSHRKHPLLKHEYPKWEQVNKAYYGIHNFDPSMPRVYVEMEPGDTVFFHPLIIHGSGANRTDGFRKAISTHYANGDKCHYISVKGTIQEEVEAEVIGMAQKRFKKLGIPVETITFQEIWKVRSRPLNDKRANL